MLTLILKTSNACNLRCVYCSLGDKDFHSVISLEGMKEALYWFLKYARSHREKEVSVIFHGGEPFLVSPSIYDICMEYANNLYDDVKINYHIQTNGTIISDEFIIVLKKYNVKVGVSIDGCKSVHDKQRYDIKGCGTYDKVVKNIVKLQQSGIKVGTLMVLTRNSLNMDLSFLKEFVELDIPIKINPLLAEGDALKHKDLFLNTGEYSDFIIRIFDYVVDNKIVLKVSPVSEIFSAIIEGKSVRGCTFSGVCSKNFICITSNGDIYPCGRFADENRCKLGNIYEGDEIDERIIRLLNERRSKLPIDCQECKYKKLCYAGCSAGMIDSDGKYYKTNLCEDYKKIFEYMHTHGLKKYKEYLQERRKEILNQIQKQA